ncbi:hypothetical protein [Three spot gourami iridovirus]|nr:hypothetical protein [South American cichlid iridovirus]AVR29875.1 hypothetical protein [Three spot gourami iridovirus]
MACNNNTFHITYCPSDQDASGPMFPGTCSSIPANAPVLVYKPATAPLTAEEELNNANSIAQACADVRDMLGKPDMPDDKALCYVVRTIAGAHLPLAMCRG